MTSPPLDPVEPNDPNDEQLFRVLDQYLSSLHSKDNQTQSGLLERHPDAAELLECLNVLDSLAPEPLAAAAARVPQPVPGDTPSDFGKFQLIAEVGRGGMGVVYRAHQVDLDRTVALKMILSSHLASGEEVRRFYAEAKAAGRLKHPNIVGIHEVGEIHGQHFFAMDFVDGASLADRLRQGPVETDTAARWLAAVARAVDYLHANKIVHRDLKPSNILLSTDETPFVTDFGLAKVFDTTSSNTQSGIIVGTPAYMAPEQAAGRAGEVSARTDVYSLGAILYELLTGRPPFQRDNPLDTLVDVLEGEPSLPTSLNSRIPRNLELVCLRCLEKEPGDRYPSASALADDLDRFLNREPVEAQPSGIAQQLRRWGRREPALVSRLGALDAAAIIVQVKYVVSGTAPLALHMAVMAVFAVWAAASFAFQKMLSQPLQAQFARFAWIATDIVCLTVVLWLSGDGVGPLLVGYPVLVAASGLFFQVGLVWFATTLSLAAYAVLMLFHPQDARPAHYPMIFALGLTVLGFVVAYQVYRVRVLSRYYEQRRFP